MIKNEIIAKIETFTNIVKNFFHSDPKVYDIDITIAKLEALRGLYGEANNHNDDEVDDLNQTIETARETRNIIEHLKKKQVEPSDDDFEDDEDDELPRHYLGDDGELIFEND